MHRRLERWQFRDNTVVGEHGVHSIIPLILYMKLGDSSRVAMRFKSFFFINYERLSVFYSCRKGAQNSDDELISGTRVMIILCDASVRL